MTDREMWQEYVKINSQAKNYNAWSFGGASADKLANMVLLKEKTATSSAYDCYVVEQVPLPKEGEYNIILDTAGKAVCITQTTKVYIVAFREVTALHAYKEGEFDGSLLSWRKCHEEFFTNVLKEIEQKFSEDMQVVCEEFKVVYPIK